jgi:hypothetical protein
MAHRKKVKKGPVVHGSLVEQRPISVARMAEFDRLGRLSEQIKERATAETITRPPSEPMESISHEQEQDS